MILIRFIPVRADEEQLVMSWADPVLTVNGVDYNLSELADGDTARHPVLLNAYRDGSDYSVSVRMPHGSRAPHATRFPEDVTLMSSGIVPVPVYDVEEEDNGLA